MDDSASRLIEPERPSAAAAPRIVFLGPSLALEQAKQLLPGAEFRPPIKRGDLEGMAPGTIVGIVDGFFASTLAISPGEIREAIDLGMLVFGAASMGALRATEVPQMLGVGKVYQLYRDGVVERDDEVAVAIDPRDNSALSEPLVNIRFAVERLARSGTIRQEDGDAIILAAQQLHFSERSYEKILAASPLGRNHDLKDLIALLRRFDLKRDDAHLLLETLATTTLLPKVEPSGRAYMHRPSETHVRAGLREPPDAPILIWETGDQVRFDELLLFLKLTGRFEAIVRKLLFDGESPAMAPMPEQAQRLLDNFRTQWGWETPEEAHVTMRDLGLGLEDAADAIEREVSVRARIESEAQKPSRKLLKAIRAQLWMDGIGLKREALRLGALSYFAAEGALQGAPRPDELIEAQRTMARLRSTFRWATVRSELARLGVSAAECDAMATRLALARRGAMPTITRLDRPPANAGAPTARAESWRSGGMAIVSSRKAPGSLRFSMAESEALEVANRIAQQMGVVRIGLVGELDTLGIHIAQAFADRAGWSSSFSSGKSETRDGARIGSIMEEVEIHAQDAFAAPERIKASYAELAGTRPVVDPVDLGLPFDTRYTPHLPIDWSPAFDLVGAQSVLVPTAALVGERLENDVLYCTRLGGKVFSTSGLGSGFSLAEAIVHAASEYIERHAYRLAEIQLDNPGGVEGQAFYFVDESSLPEAPARIVAKYRKAGAVVRILDITSDVAVPSYFVRIYDDLFETPQSTSSDGFATHPNPEVAITMALLEAGQTRGGYIAGGREDYSLQARSLGRHERPRTAVPQFQAFWFSNDRPVRPFNAAAGFSTGDILTEAEWLVDAVVNAGVPMFLVADYTLSRIAPAHAVRVILPGLETTNPLFTGPRARASIIRDLLPRGAYAR